MSDNGKNLDLDFLKLINTKNNDTVEVNHGYSLPMPNKKQLEINVCCVEVLNPRST